MAEPDNLFSATADTNKSLISAFHKHSNGSRTDTRNFLFTLFKETFPTYHVTEAVAHSISLIEFASAGKASVVHDTEEVSFKATRTWHPVGDRLERKLHPGRLVDDYRFVRILYTFEGREYLVYYVVWEEPFKSPARMFYILYPRAEDNSNIVNGHCVESDALVLAAGKWTSQLHEEIFVFDDGRWEKSKELWKSVHSASWDDVILDPYTKQTLIEDVQGFFDNQNIYSQFAVPWKRGIILHGVPGNGKTVSIKALISSLYKRGDNISSLYIKSLSTNCNTQQYSIRQIFTQARRSAPCLLVFEDLDSLVTDEIRSYFLNEVDGLESNDGILMIGSTNHLDRLDPAIAKRPSRFDRKYHFKLPGEAERVLYAEYWRKKLLQNNTVEFPEELCRIIAKLTEGFSFAYLKELFVMSLLALVRGFKGDDFEIVDTVDATATPPTEPAAGSEGAASTIPGLSAGSTPSPNTEEASKPGSTLR